MPGRASSAARKRGVLYIGHMPQGLEEQELCKYFSQFGRVIKVKVSRSIKTGKPKGYGFVQFQDDEVAQIAAQSMNNYIMFRKSLKVHLVEPEKVHDKLFENCARPVIPSKSTQRYVARLNKTSSKPEDVERRAKRRKLAAKKLKDMGYELLSPHVIRTESESTQSKSSDSTTKPSTPSKVSPASKKVKATVEKVKVTSDTKKVAKKVTVDEENAVIIRPQAALDSDEEISFNIPDDIVRSGSKSSTKKSLTGSSTKKVFPKTPLPHSKPSMTASPHSLKKSPHRSPAQVASSAGLDCGASPALASKVRRKSVAAPQTPKNKPAKMSPRVTRSVAKKRKSVV